MKERILSIDFGSKTLGVCVSDASNIIAIPLENHFFINQEKNELLLEALEKIKVFVKKYQVSKLIIGYPYKTTGTKATITTLIDDFLVLLKREISSLKVILFDERYTTKRAKDLIKERSNHKAQKDVIASCLMLQDYLNR